jgi:hypothetical protein
MKRRRKKGRKKRIQSMRERIRKQRNGEISVKETRNGEEKELAYITKSIPEISQNLL